MKIHFDYKGRKFCADLSEPLDISIPLEEGIDNPNCYYAEPVVFETVRSDDFIGSVKEGGSVNYQKITMTPHGNGTHSECYGHITSSGMTINKTLNKFHFIAKLITVKPEKAVNGDSVIRSEAVTAALADDSPEAIIVRTLPNGQDKKQRKYSGTNPPYFDHESLRVLYEKGIHHILTDLPSIDKESDGGKLLSHRTFWGLLGGDLRRDSTVTELVFIDNSFIDGLYLLNLQIPPLEADAAPSKPVLYRMMEKM